MEPVFTQGSGSRCRGILHPRLSCPASSGLRYPGDLTHATINSIDMGHWGFLECPRAAGRLGLAPGVYAFFTVRLMEFGHFASRRDAGKIARQFSAGINEYRLGTSPIGTIDVVKLRRPTIIHSFHPHDQDRIR